MTDIMGEYPVLAITKPHTRGALIYSYIAIICRYSLKGYNFLQLKRLMRQSE